MDLTTSNDVAGETFAYRILDGCGTEITTDFLRNKFVIAGATNVDFDVGWWVPGTWLNYTRTIPTNTYLVYGRLAAGGAYSNATMGLVTSGQGTPSQTTHTSGHVLGSERQRVPSHGTGYRCWPPTGSRRWLSLGGVDTLKVTAPPVPAGMNGVLNANFYMLVPVYGSDTVLHQCLGQCGRGFDQIPDPERAQLHGAIQHQLEPNQLADVVRRQ